MPITATIDSTSSSPEPSLIASLPKANLHVHAEADARLARLLARRTGAPSPDMTALLAATLALPPGMARLAQMFADNPSTTGAQQSAPENIIAHFEDLLEEDAREGAILVEVRFGRPPISLCAVLPLFREAERRVQARHPRFRAELLAMLQLGWPRAELETKIEDCVRAARVGLAGVDFIPAPYDREADWTDAYRWAARLADAGLGITAHAGEFATANLAAAIKMPGLTRLGHATYAVRDPRLVDALCASGVTVECCPTSNVILGSASSYAEHPIRQFATHGIPVTINSDDPIHLCTTIGLEYAAMAATDIAPSDLLSFTRNAVCASFTSDERRAGLLAEVEGWDNRPGCK